MSEYTELEKPDGQIRWTDLSWYETEYGNFATMDAVVLAIYEDATEFGLAYDDEVVSVGFVETSLTYDYIRITYSFIDYFDEQGEEVRDTRETEFAIERKWLDLAVII